MHAVAIRCEAGGHVKASLATGNEVENTASDDCARDLRDLTVPLGNHLEVLKGNRKGQHSIRINQQYRICFTWANDTTGGVADAVEIVDYH